MWPNEQLDNPTKETTLALQTKKTLKPFLLISLLCRALREEQMNDTDFQVFYDLVTARQVILDLC